MSGWKTKPARNWAPYALWALCALWAGCSKREAATSQPHQVLRISQRNEPATLDPQRASLPDEFFIIRTLAEGLLTPDPAGGAPLPGMAETWLCSPDGLTWTFQLRPDARWSNGDPVTAPDFVWSIRRMLTPATAAPKVSLFFGLKNARACYAGTADFDTLGVRAHDPRTLELELARPDESFPAMVASGPWIPVHPATVQALGAGPAAAAAYVGNGPFTLVDWQPGRRIVVRKNPAYWDASAIRLDGIRFIAFDSSDTEERAFRAGQIDVAMAVPYSKLDRYRQAAHPVMQTVRLHETRYLALNTTRPPLNDVRVRRALSLALDRRALTDKVLKGDQVPAWNFVPPGLGGYEPAGRLDEDAAEARRLLAAAGFPGGRGFPRFELTTWSAINLVLETIQHRWREELGIEVTLLQREARTHLAALAGGNYDLAFATAIPDYDSPLDLLQHLRSGDAGNFPQWRNSAYDALVAARDLPAAEELVLTELPLIPLYFNAKNFLVSPAVRGWREDALWTRYYKQLELQPE